MPEKGENHLTLSFARPIGDNGYAYEVRNTSSLAQNIEEYTIAVIGHNGKPPIYTMRTMTEKSRLTMENADYPQLELTEILRSVVDNITNIEAAGTKDFGLFLDLEDSETAHEALDNTIEVVLQKDGVRVDSETLPPN